MELSEAIEKAKTRAREHCKACAWPGHCDRADCLAGRLIPHTCHGDLEVFKDGLLAAAIMADEEGGDITEVKINRLLGEASE